MSQCTAPVRGHRSASAAAACPARRYRYSGYSRSYSSYSPPVSSYRSSGSYGGGGSGGGGSSGGRRSGRTRAGGSVTYSPTEWRSIEPVARKAAEQAVSHPELRDLFLCHAWDDRESSAAELFTSLESSGTSVWFSEKDVPLGTLLIREIDKGLRNSRIGIVLVTPALLKSIEQEGIAEKELSARLATDRVIPVAHGTTFEALRGGQPTAGLAVRAQHSRLVLGRGGDEGRRCGSRPRRLRHLTRRRVPSEASRCRAPPQQ